MIAHRYFYLLNITQPYQILILSVILNLLRRQTIKQGANIVLQFMCSQRYFYILKYNQTRFNCDCFFKYKKKIYSLVNILYSWGVDKGGHLYFLTYHGKFQLVHVTSNPFILTNCDTYFIQFQKSRLWWRSFFFRFYRIDCK